MLIDTEDPHPFPPGEVVDQQLPPGVQGSVVDGVPRRPDTVGDPGDGEPVVESRVVVCEVVTM